MRNLFITLMLLSALAGCLDNDDIIEMKCEDGIKTGYEWYDSHQWNGAPMSYGNSTVWELNNTSDGVLNLEIDLTTYFSEANVLIEKGYFNLSIYENDTLLWTNQTNEDILWNVSLNISVNHTIILEIQATGKDTHPESEMGDYFVMDMQAHTQAPSICS